jgi:hypothetical protein
MASIQGAVSLRRKRAASNKELKARLSGIPDAADVDEGTNGMLLPPSIR